MSVIVKGGGGGKSYDGNYLITPSTSNVIIPAKSLLTQDLVIQGDTDLVSSNIMSGKEIFGINGSAQDNSGTYAWKKQERQNTTTPVNVTINGSTGNGGGYDIDINISDSSISLDTSDFYGLELTAYDSDSGFTSYIELKNNNRVETGVIAGGNKNINSVDIIWVWDSTQKKILFKSDTGDNYYLGIIGSNKATGSKQITKYKTTYSYVNIGYVVSDNSSAYPNNATHTDGYYYTQIS